LASEGRQADLIIGNNVFAHVPDINDFVKGLKALLKPGGVVTLEFPHLMQLLEHCQFDTVYHEHFSYLCLTTTCRIFEKAGLRIWDVKELPTHGGSLRIYGCHINDPRKTEPSVQKLKQKEKERGLQDLNIYQQFQRRAEKIKQDLHGFLAKQKQEGKKVLGYGAAAKGNTLLNFAEVKPDLLPAVYDAAPSKQNKFMPGSRIPIRPPSEMAKDDPDFVVILPWNIADEVRQENKLLLHSKTKFVVNMPKFKIF